MEIFKEFTFEAAHWLPNVPPEHKCRRMHGHSFHVAVYVAGAIDPKLGWVADFFEVKSAFAPFLDQLDHRCLNEIEGLENPTSENIARWIWWKLKPVLPGISKVVVRETCNSGCSYEGKDE